MDFLTDLLLNEGSPSLRRLVVVKTAAGGTLKVDVTRGPMKAQRPVVSRLTNFPRGSKGRS